LEREAIVKSATGRLLGHLSIAKKPPFAVLVLRAVAAVALVGGIAARFHANLTATQDMIASDAAPEPAKGAWFERWWMGVQESVKRAE
jgi:hypothetical protein